MDDLVIGMAGSGGDGIVTKSSPRSVEDTVSRLTGLVESKGMNVFAVIDHSGEAERHGLELRATKVVIFGSPTAGTPRKRPMQDWRTG